MFTVRISFIFDVYNVLPLMFFYAHPFFDSIGHSYYLRWIYVHFIYLTNKWHAPPAFYSLSKISFIFLFFLFIFKIVKCDNKNHLEVFPLFFLLLLVIVFLCMCVYLSYVTLFDWHKLIGSSFFIVALVWLSTICYATVWFGFWYGAYIVALHQNLVKANPF